MATVIGFQIVIQISHVLCLGVNIAKKANCGKSARRNIKITLLKEHFIIKIALFKEYFIISHIDSL